MDYRVHVKLWQGLSLCLQTWREEHCLWSWLASELHQSKNSWDNDTSWRNLEPLWCPHACRWGHGCRHLDKKSHHKTQWGPWIEIHHLGLECTNVEPVKDNGSVPGLIQEELKVVWLAVKLDRQSLCASFEELSSRLVRVVENIRISKGWSQCKMRCLSSHGDLGDQAMMKSLTWKKSLMSECSTWLAIEC